MESKSKELIRESPDPKEESSPNPQQDDQEAGDQGELILKELGLTILDPSSLQRLNQSILTLDLKQNSISSFDSRVFPYLKHLRNLDLRNNCLESIPTELVRLTRLRHLRLDNNQISALPSQIGSLGALEVLTMSCNKLFGLPGSIRGLKNLHTLIINENQIRYLPSELGYLKNLRSLYFHRNRFHAFPCSIYQLKNLKEFSLEWFRYTNPPLPRVLKGQVGEAMIESLRGLCKLLLKHKMKECCLITFLEHFSEKPVDLNRPDHRNRTPLHMAASEGDCGVIEGLIIAKGELNILDKENCTPVCLALREDKINAAKTLIYSGADINKGGGVLGSPLHMAVIKMEHGLVRDFIKLNANVNAVDGEGNTPLHLILSIFSKNPKKCKSIADSLIAAKAAPNEFNKDKWACIHLAARRGQIEGLRWIVRARSSHVLRGRSPTFDLNIKGGTHGWTPLHLAGHAGHFKIVQYLINAQANLFVRNSEGKTPRQTSRGNLALSKLFCRAEFAWLETNIVQTGSQASREVNKKLISKNDQENVSQNGQVPNLRMDGLRKKLANEIKVSTTNRNMMNKSMASHNNSSHQDDSSLDEITPEIDSHQQVHSENQEEGVLVGKSIKDHYSMPNKINILRVNKGIDSNGVAPGGARYTPPSLFSYRSAGFEDTIVEPSNRRYTVSGMSTAFSSEEPSLNYMSRSNDSESARRTEAPLGGKKINFGKIRTVLLDRECAESRKLKAIFLIKTVISNLLLKKGRNNVILTGLSCFVSSLYDELQSFPGNELVRRELAYLLGQLQDNRSISFLETSVKNIMESSLVRIEASNAVNLISTNIPITSRLRGSVKNINTGDYTSLTKSYDFSMTQHRQTFSEWKRRGDNDSLTGYNFMDLPMNSKI
eukprot:CAMPEP_0114997594 /NCGR_PEP_ID=MMETSP0216-20121206/14991_1 /TAXON_ID=223996 /ORGANISM="Protocruzia adherens, Strain Boccale" /LENGTH=886 /DNA_ID=CAMNT_0002362003 /DNA_START=91 /DNA_END=2751 /DNA_ORIENTATION=-